MDFLKATQIGSFGYNHQGTVLGRYDFCVALYALSSTHISEQLSGIA